MANNGYNENGGPILHISQTGGKKNWRDATFTLKKPRGEPNKLPLSDLLSRTFSYAHRPTIRYIGEVAAKAKARIRRELNRRYPLEGIRQTR